MFIWPNKVSPCTYQYDLGNKVSLLGACIKFDLGYINEYDFGPYGFQSWFGLIKMLRYFFYRDQQNILLKLQGKFVHYCPYNLEEYLAIKEEVFDVTILFDSFTHI